MPPKGCRNVRRRPSARPVTGIVQPDDVVHGNLPLCAHPGGRNRAEPIASDWLREYDAALLVIMREGRMVAVGRFSTWALEQLMQPGDIVQYDDGRRMEFMRQVHSEEETTGTS